MESSPNHLREKDSFPDLSLSFEVGFKLGKASQHIEGICKKYHASICMKSSSFFFNIHLKPIWRSQLRNVFNYVTNAPVFGHGESPPDQIRRRVLSAQWHLQYLLHNDTRLRHLEERHKEVAILFFWGLGPPFFEGNGIWGKTFLNCAVVFFRWWTLHHFRIHNSI